MKKMMKIKTLVLCLIVCMGAVGCGVKSSESSFNAGMQDNWANEKNPNFDLMEPGLDGESGDKTQTPNQSGEVNISSAQKLIRRMTLQFETTDYEKSVSDLLNYVKTAGGYVENSSVSGKTKSNPNALGQAKYVLRIPTAMLDEFVNMMDGVGTLRTKDETAEDVTLRYTSIQSHIEALTIEYDRLLEMLKQADDMETMLMIEERLTSVRYELTDYESQKRVYDNLIDYSTVTVYINEVRKIVMEEPQKELNYWEQLEKDILSNLADIGFFFADLFHDIIVNLPQLVMLAAVIVFGVFGIKKMMRKKRSKEKNVEEEKKEEIKE